MSLELDMLYKLSDPFYALCISLPTIVISALFAFTKIRRATEWRNRFSFVAEILVVVGVVGVFAFVSRARNDSLTAKYIKDLKDAEYVQAVDSNQLKKAFCAESHLSLPNTVIANKEACEKFTDALKMFSLNPSLYFLARDYQRISEIPNLSANNVKLLTDAAKSTRVLLKIEDNKALHELRLREASSRVSWPFVLLIASLVCVGVGFKCGRAAADLWPQNNDDAIDSVNHVVDLTNHTVDTANGAADSQS